MTGAQAVFGIAGTGRMAARMAMTLQGCPGVRIGAVASATPERARAFADRFGIGTATDLAGLAAASELDIVYVANATRHHAATSIALLQAGRAVLCEKPFALTSDEGARVIGAAQRGGAFFMEALWTLALPAYRRLIALAEAGAAGRAASLDFSFGYPVHEADRARLTDPADGGVLFDRAGYGVAAALALLGDGTLAAAQVSKAGAVLDLDHGDAGASRIAVSAAALLPNSLHLGGSAGALGLKPPSLAAEAVWQQPFTPAPLGDETQGGWRQRLKAQPAARRAKAALAGPRSEWHSYGSDPYAPMIAAVQAALAQGQTEAAPMPWARSLAVLEILDAARRKAPPQ